MARVVRDCVGTCVAIPVAVASAKSAAVAYRRGGDVRAVWNLGEETAAAIGRAQDHRLRKARVVERDGDAGIEIAVENVGDGAFRALAAPAWVEDAASPIGVPVSRGATVAESVFPDAIRRPDPDEIRVADEIAPETRYVRIESKTDDRSEAIGATVE